MGAQKATRKSRIKLRPADPFDLIRLIARTQSDPRKAVAELVQNSLDAGASRVDLTWFTHEGTRALLVRDDGAGVFPEMERRAALERIATTIGHSHKRNMDAAERHRQMTLGKYGIGLLGFWSVGNRMEIRTRVRGGETWLLRLVEDSRDAEVAPARASRLQHEDTSTEVTVFQVHAAAEPQVKPRRLAAYLATELRGQLLARDVEVVIHDRVARGLAQKRIVVRPQRYRGAPIPELRELPVPGFAPAQLELTLLPEPEAHQGRARLGCGGTIVLDDLALLDGPDEPRAPWSSGRFDGVVDFPDLEVAPGTRRGFVPNAAAEALRAALPALEARLAALLEDEAERKEREAQADDAKNLRRIFRRLARALPQYAMPAVREAKDSNTEASGGEPVPETDEAAEGLETPPVAEPEFLYPPGPLAAVTLRPAVAVVPPEGRRVFRAVPRDADGREIASGVSFEWSLDGAGTLSPEDGRARYEAPRHAAEAVLVVAASAGADAASASARIHVRDDLESEPGGGPGVPDPTPVEAPREPWRSRIVDGVWQYNSGHPDYRLVQSDAKRRLRYLAFLFAKEIVLRNFGAPPDTHVLERMVEVLTHVELAADGRGRS